MTTTIQANHIQTTNHLVGNGIAATDGEIGKCSDILFSDKNWELAYIVVDTSQWLPGRKTLISPHSINRKILEDEDSDSRVIPLNLTKKAIKESPELAQDAPVSQRFEKELRAYYNWPQYGYMGGAWGLPMSYVTPPNNVDGTYEKAKNVEDEVDLRSVQEVSGYTLANGKTELGSVEGFLIDMDHFSLPFVFVRIGGVANRHHTIIPAVSIESISYKNRIVDTRLSGSILEHSPKFDVEDARDLNQEMEEKINDYYKAEVK